MNDTNIDAIIKNHEGQKITKEGVLSQLKNSLKYRSDIYKKSCFNYACSNYFAQDRFGCKLYSNVKECKTAAIYDKEFCEFVQ